MKRILLATTLLAATSGFAAAEITLSGDARMGIVSDFDNPLATTGLVAGETQFTSRARVKFNMSGETDGGLTFGASFRADNAGGASSGTAGEVFISGAFGKLSMGDIDGAAQSAVGQVSGVGLTGLSDLNEVTYISTGGNTIPFGGTMADPMARYEYSAGSFTGYLSVTNPSGVGDGMAVGVKYAFGDYTIAAGYETADDLVNSDSNLVIGATATFGALTGKVIWSSIDAEPGSDQEQLAVSVDYKADALTLTAFYKDVKTPLATYAGSDAYGIGASYDLGGGASLVGGYAKNDTTNDDSFDMGVSFSF